MLLILQVNDGEGLAERQADVPDALTIARAIVDDLENAAACETANDFLANVENARDRLRELTRELRDLVKP